MLSDFQLALGRAVRTRQAPDGSSDLAAANRGILPGLTCAERAFLEGLGESPGFRFAAGVQRSWCDLRTRNAARVVLSALPTERARELVDAWVEQGGGTSSFFASEADELLEFIAARLPPHSMANNLCRVEQAVRRANQATATFVAPSLRKFEASQRLRQGRAATLLLLPAGGELREGRPDKGAVGGRAEALGVPLEMAMLFAPGIAGLCREARSEEIALWHACAPSTPTGALVQHEDEGRRRTVSDLLMQGVLEIAPVVSSPRGPGC